MKLTLLLITSVCLFSSTQAELNYSYYEGTWTALPDFNSLTAAKKGTSLNIDLNYRNRDLNFAFKWEGTITIPTTTACRMRFVRGYHCLDCRFQGQSS